MSRLLNWVKVHARPRTTCGLRVAFVGLVLAGGLSATACNGNKTSPNRRTGVATGAHIAEEVVVDALSPEELDALGPAVAALLDGKGEAPVPRRLKNSAGAVYVALRVEGESVGSAWGPDGNMEASLAGALEAAKSQAGGRAAEVDWVELDFAHDFHRFEQTTKKMIKHDVSNRHRGVRGLELSHGDSFLRIAPTKHIVENVKFSELVARFLKAEGISRDDWESSGKARWFQAHQVLVKLGDSPTATSLLRGNEVVPASAVTQASTKELATMAGDWLIRHVRDDGRATYLWYPSTSAEDPSNNMIRQWMATNCLEKIADDRDDQAVWDVVEKNIDYNLEHFYVQDEDTGFGYIKHQGRSKLGAISLATMALVGHPKHEKWATQTEAMLKTLDELHHEDGSFDNFFVPRSAGGGNVNNFYPGETLLLWSVLYVRDRDPALLAKFMKSFEYFSKWHLEHRKPSFTPWHTQAYYNVWTVTKDQRLADFIFEMNDWLIEVMQQWEDDEVLYPDEKGRFFSREREVDKFGPPHASSTGVYIEGLIDAYRLAKELGDSKRQERYRKSLARAMRSMMQLQFVDDVDMYYVTDKDMTRGGMRTSVYRNEIRVDNVQHGLMGIIKMIRAFGPDDYATQ